METALNEEILSEFEELNKMQIGTEQYRKTVDGLTKLVDRANDSEKIKADREDKAVRREMDGEAEREQLKEAKKKR